jgi:hypothetical protein
MRKNKNLLKRRNFYLFIFSLAYYTYEYRLRGPKLYRCGLVFGRCEARISARIYTTVTKVYRGFL